MGIGAGEDSELDRREHMDPGAILMGGLVTADQKRKKPVPDGPAQTMGLHRKPLRPFGYRLLNETATGTAFALCRLNVWVRGAF